MDGGAWWAAVHGVTKSRTQLSSFIFTFTFIRWKRKWQPLQCSCLENPRDGGAWWAAIYRVAQSRTLKQLSSSSSIAIFTSFLCLKTLSPSTEHHRSSLLSTERLHLCEKVSTTPLRYSLPLYHDLFFFRAILIPTAATNWVT